MDRLWCDKYRPKSLDSLEYNKPMGMMLKKLSDSEDLPHLLIYGPNGAGKKTRIMAFLSEVYGSGVYKLKQDNWEFKVSATSSTKVDCSVLSSNYHIDITPAECENYDRVVLQKLIKEVASTHQIDTRAQKNFKIIVINEVDRLSREAQAALRRTMEKYVGVCRLILVCENLGRVIQPLRSRCLLIRVPAPKQKDIEKVLSVISKRENFGIPDQAFTKIAEGSERNMRRAILQLQTIRMKNQNLNQGLQNLHVPEWRMAIRNIFDMIVKEQSPKMLRQTREKVYDLLVNCIPGDLIIKYLMIDLLSRMDSDVKYDVIYYAAYHENKLQKGSKAVFHIEAFIARIMLICKNFFAALSNF